MINSYNDIKSKIEALFKERSANDFISICTAALGGKRGLNRTDLIRAVASDSIDKVHKILEPLVDRLITDNKFLAEGDDQYKSTPLGGNEYRLTKIKNKDKYGRGAEDYIVNAKENSCTCPEFTNRLRNMFLPCKHQYMISSVTGSSIQKLVRLADLLDKKCHYGEANQIDVLVKRFAYVFAPDTEITLCRGEYLPKEEWDCGAMSFDEYKRRRMQGDWTYFGSGHDDLDGKLFFSTDYEVAKNYGDVVLVVKAPFSVICLDINMADDLLHDVRSWVPKFYREKSQVWCDYFEQNFIKPLMANKVLWPIIKDIVDVFDSTTSKSDWDYAKEQLEDEDTEDYSIEINKETRDRIDEELEALQFDPEFMSEYLETSPRNQVFIEQEDFGRIKVIDVLKVE